MTAVIDPPLSTAWKTPDALEDYCPKCQRTPAMRRLHGPCAGPFGTGWMCGRCYLEAIDYGNACAYVTGYRPSAGIEWDRQCADLERGLPVDPLNFAADMGRYLLAEYRPPRNRPDLEHPVVALLCEVSFAIAEGHGPSPWSTEPAPAVAELILTAMNAGGCAVVDVDPDRTDHRGVVVAALAEIIHRLPLERSDMDGARLILRTLTDAGFAVVEVP